MRVFFVAVFVGISLSSAAQEFGGNPPSVKWRQVNTNAAKVIFPAGLDSIAREVASITERLNNESFFSIGSRKRKVSIVLQNQTTVSNAYVALGPFRSEFFLTPQQNSFSLGSLPWHQQLAIHEFRHVQQNNNFNVGLSQVVGTLFGQQGQAFANSLVIPDWFYEGDAVFNETNVSMQGRGRIPFFYNGYRSLWTAGKHYNWMKLRNGSLRDYTPDHYETGYLLIAYGNEKFGPDFWGKVTRDAASYKGLFYPFQQAIKKYSGQSYSTFRTAALDYFKNEFNSTSTYATASPKHFVADEHFPAYIGADSILLVKSSYKKIPAFVIRSNGKDARIRIRDVSLDEQFSYRNGKVVYASFRPDARWGWRNYSELQLLDIKSGRQRRITKKSKYFSPDISEDGSTIVAVETNAKGATALHLIDAGNGMLIKAVPNPDGLYYTYPKFYNASKVITAVRNRTGQMSLALVDLASGQTDYLLPFSYQVLGFPVVQHDTAFFTASYEKNDRLMAYSFSDKKLLMVNANTPAQAIGMYEPTVNQENVTWSAATAAGYQLTTITKQVLSWTPVAASSWAAASETFGIEQLDANRAFLAHVTPGNYEVKKYRKTSGLINFHSLIPLVDDPEYSLSLLGQNILNTLETDVSVLYNRNEQYKELSFNTAYAGWFPVISAGGNFTMDRRGLYRGNRVYWNEWEGRGGVSLPLNLSKGRQITGVTVGADYVYRKQQFEGLYKDTFVNQSFSYVNSYVVLTNQVQKARQQIYPRYAQTLTVQYRNAISDINKKQFLASGNLYLPGLFSTHNLIITAAYHMRDSTGVPVFSNNFPFSRGYTAENFYRMKKAGVNYHFPLLYPDLGIANIVYFLRTRANLFFDYTRIQDFNNARRTVELDFRSVGTEIFFDTKWWNQLPVSFGFRYSRLIDRDLFGNVGSDRFEIILPINLIGG